MEITKIKVTKQEIRIYKSDGAIIPFNFSQTFLDSLLGRHNKYTISDKNANVTWYQLSDNVDAKQDSQSENNDESKNDLELSAVEVLKTLGYEFTVKAESIAIENKYTVQQLQGVAVEGKITVHSLKKID